MGVEFDLEPTRRGLYLYDGTTWTHLSADPAHETYNQLIQDILFISTVERFVVAAGETDNGGLFTSNDTSGAWTDWETMGIGLPVDFWGQAVAQDPTGAQAVYVSTARPVSTDYIYKCSAATSTMAAGCDLYYTGLVDETLGTLLFDGLGSVHLPEYITIPPK